MADGERSAEQRGLVAFRGESDAQACPLALHHLLSFPTPHLPPAASQHAEISSTPFNYPRNPLYSSLLAPFSRAPYVERGAPPPALPTTTGDSTLPHTSQHFSQLVPALPTPISTNLRLCLSMCAALLEALHSPPPNRLHPPPPRPHPLYRLVVKTE